MSFRIYLDTHIAKAVATQLRSNGLDVVRCEEVHMANATDKAHLTYATDNERVMVTQDDDFLKIAAKWANNGQNHAGIFIVNTQLRGQGAIGVIVREVMELYNLIDGGAGTLQDDIINQINYIG